MQLSALMLAPSLARALANARAGVAALRRPIFAPGKIVCVYLRFHNLIKNIFHPSFVSFPDADKGRPHCQQISKPGGLVSPQFTQRIGAEGAGPRSNSARIPRARASCAGPMIQISG